MSFKKIFKDYQPDFDTPVLELDAEEMVKQHMYLQSGEANMKGPRGRDLGLPENLQKRLCNLDRIILHVMHNRHFVPGMPLLES